MRLQPKPILLLLLLFVTCLQVLAEVTAVHKPTTFADSALANRPSSPERKTNALLAGNCYDINWATWNIPNSVTSTTGSIIDADGSPISITMTANYSFDSTPSIYSYNRLSGYPSSIPNSTVPRTTWAAGTGGTTTMCFSRKVTNPVLLLASLGSSAPISSTLNFSIPYVVLHDGGGMVYNNNTSLTGTEGYAVIMFPGEFTCVTINSNTPEFYTNITWGIRPQPFQITLTDQPSACGAATITASGGVSYKWSGGESPNSATNTFYQSGSYTVTVTNADGCVTSAVRNLAIGAALNPTIITYAESCGSVTLMASGAATYLWSGGSDPTSSTNTFTTSGTYTLTVTDGNNCSRVISHTVTVPNVSNNIITPSKTQVCSGQAANVTLIGNQPTGFSPAVVYSWQSSPDNISWTNLAGFDQQSVVYTGIVSQQLYLRRVSTQGNCVTYSNVVHLTSLPTVTTAVAGPDRQLCQQTQLTLAANTPTPDETGTWTVLAPAAYNPFNGISSHNPNAVISNLPTNVQIQLKWTIAKPLCGQQTESIVNITNNGKPSVSSFTLPEQTEPVIIDHIAGTITVLVNPGTDITSLSPIITANGTLAPASGTQQNFSGPVTYTITSACATATYTVTLKQVQAAQLNACISIANLLLPGKVSTTGATYEWQRLSNAIWQPVPANGSEKDYLAIPPSPQGATVQKVLYRCKVSIAANVSYDPYYEVNFYPQLAGNSITANKQFICYGENGTVTFTGNVPGNIAAATSVTYQWQRSADNSNWQNINLATQQNLTYNAISTQTVYIRRMASAGGCADYSNVLQVTYGTQVTTANAGAAQVVCPGAPVMLNANTPAGDESGTWSVVSPAGYNPFDAGSINNPSATINNLPLNSDIILKWSIRKKQCANVSESNVTIRANSLPIVTAGSNAIINIGGSTLLNGSITGTYSSISWTPATGLNNPASITPIASPLTTTTYTLIAKNSAGCTVSASVKVIVNTDLIIPNTITPNNDGINDVWNIKNLDNYYNTTVDIFNRFGSSIYHSNGYPTPWNGTFKGQKLPAGVYYYIIQVKEIGVKKAGSITLLY